MNWKIKFSKQSKKYYLKLSINERKRIKDILIDISILDFPPTHKDVIPLLGKLDGFFRLRVGKYRIVFSLLKEKKIIAIVNFLPRGDIYKK